MKPRKTTEPVIFQHCSVPLPFKIRLCSKNDLSNLEWFGMFTSHRQIIRTTFRAQKRGEALMLMAETNCLPAGQIWLDLVKKRAQSVGIIWAMRVIPWLQRMGIGACLMGAAEEVLRNRGYAWAELGVEKHNPDAQRFYERRGFIMVGEEREEYQYTTPGGFKKLVDVDVWIFRKNLEAACTNLPAKLEEPPAVLATL